MLWLLGRADGTSAAALGGATLLVWAVAGGVNFLNGQRALFQALRSQNVLPSQQQVIEENLRTAVEDLQRLTEAYGQFLVWSRVLGAVVQDPLRTQAPAGADRTTIRRGLPLSTALGRARVDGDRLGEVAAELRRGLFVPGWLSGPWDTAVSRAAARLGPRGNELGDIEGAIFAEPAGPGSLLHEWADVVVRERPFAAASGERAWRTCMARVESGDGDGLAERLLLQVDPDDATAGRPVTRAQFMAGVDEPRGDPVDAKRFDSATLSVAAGGSTATAVEASVASTAPRGLSRTAVLVELGRPAPAWSFAACAADTPRRTASGADTRHPLLGGMLRTGGRAGERREWMDVNPDGKSHRIAVLRRWHASIAGTGEPVPTVADLDKVGAAGTVWPPHVDRTSLAPWEQTIRWLFEQVALGVPDPVGALPPHLRLPRTPPRSAPRRSGPAPAPRLASAAPTPRPHPVPGPAVPDAGSPVDSEDLLARAVRWRDDVVARGEVDAAALKQGLLQSLVARNLRTVEEITPRLPVSLAHLAPELAAVLDAGTPPPATGPDPTAAPGRPAPPSPTGPDPTVGTAGTDDAATAGVPPPVEPPSETGPTIDAQLKGLRFSRFLHLDVAEAGIELDVAEGPTGGIELRWDGPADGAAEERTGTGQPPVVIYRVVSDDAGEPQSPDEEDAEPIAVTCGNTATDDRPFTRAVRYFAVWRHTGPTEEDAARAQPVPHAMGVHVVPPRDVEVHYDHPRVVGGWTPLSGTDRVVVTRTVRGAGRHAPHDERWVGYEHFDDGFKDTRPVPGVENRVLGAHGRRDQRIDRPVPAGPVPGTGTGTARGRRGPRTGPARPGGRAGRAAPRLRPDVDPTPGRCGADLPHRAAARRRPRRA